MWAVDCVLCGIGLGVCWVPSEWPWQICCRANGCLRNRTTASIEICSKDDSECHELLGAELEEESQADHCG